MFCKEVGQQQEVQAATEGDPPWGVPCALVAVEGDTAVAVVVVEGPEDVAVAALGDEDSSHIELDHT